MALQGIIEHMLFNPTLGWTPRLSGFVLSSDLSTEDIQGFPACGDGKPQNVNTIQGVETFTLTLSNQVFDFLDFERLTGQKATKFGDPELATFSLPEAKCFTVPNASPYTVTITGLAADQALQITTQSLTDPQHIEQIPSAGPAADGKFFVTANTVTFHSAQAGEQILINRFKTVSAGRSIGIANKSIGQTSFRGTMIGPNFSNPTKIYVPSATRASGLSFGTGQTSDTEYRLNLAGGYTLPFVIWEES